MKNIGNTAETFLKEEGKHLKTIMKNQGKIIEKVGKNTFQGMKTAGNAVKALIKEEGKNFKIFVKTQGKNLKVGIKKEAVLAYKGLKKAPRILGQVIGQFTNGLVCSLFGFVPGSIGIVLGLAAIGTIGYYAYNHPDEVKNFANSVVNAAKDVASSSTNFFNN